MCIATARKRNSPLSKTEKCEEKWEELSKTEKSIEKVYIHSNQ
jgi:hypothetical protein